ncbi:MAG: ATP-dependent helicase [Minisyncoccia bacterium]|jgi:DNA helicase-2/ATP-dependent DNA helicase PcrA
MSDKLLNSSQREAVEAIKGPVLVIAGPGSGKTRVIEYRVLNLIEHGIKPESILLLTFTRRAAAEMLNRAAEHDPRARKVDGGTFHSFAYKLLKQYGAQVGLPKNLMILDEDDAQEALGRIATKLGFAEGDKRFPKKNTLRSVLSASINKNRSIESILEKEYEHLSQFAGDIEKVGKNYAEYKKENGYLDYDDLLSYAREVLKNEQIRNILSRKYEFVMVDEYQDTNKLQGDITYLLASGHRNVMVVGDDAQSIYGFRGAYHENIMSFPEQFKDCKVVKLESNYRSTQAILDLSNAVLDNMENKFKKVLTAARENAGEKPTIMYFGDAEEEAGWVKEKIQENILNGIPIAHQAVLFRSSYISIQLQAEMARAGIPFKVFGGLKFYETAHVKDVLAHLKVLANFKDELSWSRVFTLLPGVGAKTAETIASRIHRAGDLKSALDVLGEFGEGYKYSEHLVELKETLMKAFGAKVSVGEKFGMVVDYYMPILKDKFDEWPNRLNDLEALRKITYNYTNLEDLLADLAIEIPDDEQKGKDAEKEEKPLTLSTIHSAKGLEWDVVFLLGVAEGTLPSKMALGKSGEEIEEEHRLFYVAITRARNKLYLLFHLAGDMGPMTFNRLSRFVDDPSVLLSVEHKDLSMMGAKDKTTYDDENDGIEEESVDY